MTNCWLGYCAFHLGDYQRSLSIYQSLGRAKTPPEDLSSNLACCFFFLGMYPQSEKVILSTNTNFLSTNNVISKIVYSNKQPSGNSRNSDNHLSTPCVFKWGAEGREYRTSGKKLLQQIVYIRYFQVYRVRVYCKCASVSMHGTHHSTLGASATKYSQHFNIVILLM